MSLVEQLKLRIAAAMKAGRTVEKEILRLALGEVQTAEARGGPVTDEGVVAIVRKLIKSNDETIGQSSDDAQKKTLAEENAVLATLLPATLGVPQIVEALAPVRDAIRAAPNDGAATGVAMKHLKGANVPANGKDVGAAVKALRAG